MNGNIQKLKLVKESVIRLPQIQLPWDNGEELAWKWNIWDEKTDKIFVFYKS